MSPLKYKESCIVEEIKYKFGCLAPAIVIIVVLSFMNKRVKLRPDLCNGRPAIPVPVDFLGSDSNRFTVAFAFGATAATCFRLFIFVTVAPFAVFGFSPWEEAFNTWVRAWCSSIINYPYLACLNTDYRIVGASIGLAYSFVRFVVDILLYFGCVYSKNIGDVDILDIGFVRYLEFITALPSLLCIMFLVGKFAIWTYREVKYLFKQRASTQETSCFAFHLRRMDEQTLVEDNEIRHVKMLLSNRLNEKRVTDNDPWYVKLKYTVWEPRSDFRFSKQFLSSLMVSVIFIYQVTIFFISFDILMFRMYHILYPNYGKLWDTLKVFFIASQALAALVSLLQILYFTKMHRKHVLSAYKSRSEFVSDVVIQPRILVTKSLNYCGYQIAFTGIGFIVVSLAIFCLLLPVLWVTYTTMEQGKDYVLEKLKNQFLAFLPVIIVCIFTWIFSNVLSRFVFRDRYYSNTLVIDNRRLYCVMSYLNFFFGILVGFWSGLMSRVIKGTVLGLLYIPRLDRTSTMRGHHAMDSGHMAYVSFVNVLVTFRHPVMLCFCQILIDRRNAQINESGQSPDNRPRVSTKALNRWFLAVLLIQNPGLLHMRSRMNARLTSGEAETITLN